RHTRSKRDWSSDVCSSDLDDPAIIDGWVHDIVQHPNGIIILPESPPANEATGNVRIVNGVVQTGLNVARYEDGTTIAPKPLRMRSEERRVGKEERRGVVWL